MCVVLQMLSMGSSASFVVDVSDSSHFSSLAYMVSTSPGHGFGACLVALVNDTKVLCGNVYNALTQTHAQIGTCMRTCIRPSMHA